MAVVLGEPRLTIFPVHGRDQLVADPGALFDRYALQVSVEAVPLEIAAAARAVPTVQRRDPGLLRGALDRHAADVHVHDVRLDPALHDFTREVDPFRGEDLHEGL